MVSIAANLLGVQFVFGATEDMMRKTLTLVLALGWAACFIAQAVLVPQHPVLGVAGAGAVAAAFAALASAAVAGLFLWIVTCLLSERDRDLGQGPKLIFADWLRIAFAAAALITSCAVIAVLATPHAHLAAVGFLQLAALSASYLVMSREIRQTPRRQAANDNVPLGTRLLAWNASRNAMYDRLPNGRTATRGEGRR